MRFKGFIGPSYTLASLNVECQRCMNMYPETIETGTGKDGEVASLVYTPGLRLLVTLPTSPVRGTYFDSTDQLWAVAGNTLYKITSAWAYTAVGQLLTSTGAVSFSDNGFQVVVVDGDNGYYYQIVSETFFQIIDENFLGATHVAFMDSYFIFNDPDTESFYVSPLNAVTPFNALAIASAEAIPGVLVGLVAMQQNLYLFGNRGTEIWYDAGNTPMPFSRVQGAVLEIGCAAAFSIQKIQDSVYWVGQDPTGKGIVYHAQGMQSQRISTYAIELKISEAGDVSNSRAWSYQQNGHTFYCLNVPGLDTTFVYDISTGLWHERAYLSAGNYSRHLADCHAYAYNTNVVGDYSSGNLYALDLATYSDNGNPIVRERASPHITKDIERIIHSRFWLDMETGVGIDGSGQGSAPTAMLQWSNDNGHSWSNEHWTSVGPIGSRRTRAIWRRLGNARDRVYRVRISDPIQVTILGAEIDIEETSA